MTLKILLKFYTVIKIDFGDNEQKIDSHAPRLRDNAGLPFSLDFSSLIRPATEAY